MKAKFYQILSSSPDKKQEDRSQESESSGHRVGGETSKTEQEDSGKQAADH